MTLTRFTQIATSLLLVSQALIAGAGEIKPYTPQEFDRLAQAGRPVLLDVSAPWCPTCRAQKPIVEDLMKQPAYKDVTLLAIDFDSNKTALRRFKVSSQSTLIGYRGTTEVGRSVGDTSRDGIEALVKRTTQ